MLIRNTLCYDEKKQKECLNEYLADEEMRKETIDLFAKAIKEFGLREKQ